MNAAPETPTDVQDADTLGVAFLAIPPQATTAVVFVHGLGGHRLKSWGAPGQPGAFMARLQADLPQVAVATYSYTSELKTIVADQTLTLSKMANEWARQIRQVLLTRFDTVVIVAHCLGGLLTTMGISALLAECGSSDSERLRRKRVILFLLDAPHDLPSQGPWPWLSGFLDALKLSPEAFRASAALWRKSVLAPNNFPLSVQAYALTSGQNGWVTALHPDADLPPERVCKAHLSHEDLARAPADGVFMPYEFVLSRLGELG